MYQRMPKIYFQWNVSPTSDEGRQVILIRIQIEVEYLQEDIVRESVDSDSCERFRLACIR